MTTNLLFDTRGNATETRTENYVIENETTTDGNNVSTVTTYQRFTEGSLSQYVYDHRSNVTDSVTISYRMGLIEGQDPSQASSYEAYPREIITTSNRDFDARGNAHTVLTNHHSLNDDIDSLSSLRSLTFDNVTDFASFEYGSLTETNLFNFRNLHQSIK